MTKLTSIAALILLGASSAMASNPRQDLADAISEIYRVQRSPNLSGQEQSSLAFAQEKLRSVELALTQNAGGTRAAIPLPRAGTESSDDYYARLEAQLKVSAKIAPRTGRETSDDFKKRLAAIVKTFNP